jgi:RHS repeat-associated protein
VSYGYSDNGNLTSKSDFASLYNYAAANSRSSGCGPHAAYQVTLTQSGTGTYTCDANGNVYASTVRALQLTYNADNQPRTSTASGGNMSWAYDAYGHMSYETSATRGNRVFGPHGYEQVLSSGAQIHELGPIIVTRQGGTDKITTALRDRLGSTIDTIDSGLPSFGNTRTYDAFGAARNGDMTGRGGTLNLADTIHGFTKHDHADEVQLVHMGGRIYDYNLGRFLSVDPIIGNPLSSQSLNPYSYLGNNPLSGTDPTGYAACSTGTNFTGDNGPSCEDVGASATQVGSASVSERNDAIAHYFGAAYGSPSTYAHLGSNGAVGMSNQGAGGTKNAEAPASDQLALSNTPTTKSGEQPAAESQNQKTTTTLGTVNVTATSTSAISAPSHDIGFYLSQKYGPNMPYYHRYGGPGPGDWAVCHPSSSAWCTNERGYDALTRFVYPNQDPSKPVQDRDVNTIYWPWPFDSVAVGDIRTFLEPTTFSVYNITLPNHDFYDGYVRRQIVTQGDTLYLRTTGEGNNSGEFRWMENVATWRPGFNMSNENFRQYMIQSWLKEQP